MLRAISESLLDRSDQSRFLSQLGKVLKRVTNTGELTGLMLVELQEFSRIATQIGYEASDAVLVKFGMSLTTIGKNKSSVARIGDHKYAIILEGLKNEGHAVLAANKIERMAKEPIVSPDGHVVLDVAIGVALFPEQADSAEALLQRAELALAAAAKGEASHEIYSPGITKEIASLWGMENEILSALEHDEFEVFYQPKVSFPVAESAGSIRALTWFVLNTALRQSSSWTKKWPNLAVSVNVTAIDIRDSEFVDVVTEAVRMWGGIYERLILEVTESAIVTDPETCFERLRELRDKGVTISIDDFGTGYSSLSHFKNIPADEIKVDQSFVMNMLNDKADELIIRSIIDLAHSFDKKVIAEGVENAEVEALLREIGCDFAQGYYYDKPMPHDQIVAWLKEFEPKA
jgi:diguanylate cyclase (GGDEF)-like protein